MPSSSFSPPWTALVSLWRDCIAPKEHGSWSLAFEPIALSLLVVPSMPGVCLAVVFTAVFFTRRPFRQTWSEHRSERRAAARWACILCFVAATLGLAAGIAFAGVAWTVWLLPVAFAGGAFAFYDARGAGREEAAEVTGAAAFALVPAAFAILGGWSAASAAALSVIAASRSVPSVLFVRAFVRAGKSGLRRDVPAVASAVAAVLAGVGLVAMRMVPFIALVAMVGFAARALVVLLIVRPKWRARTLGMMEAILGVLFVAGLAIGWRL